MVPSPGNPQSLNRYSYVLNNALKYVDPTGHYECESTGNCQPPQITNPNANSFGIHFIADAGQAWNAHDSGQVLDAARAIGGRLVSALQSASRLAHKLEGAAKRFSPAMVFKQVMGAITFHRSANACPAQDGCWAWTRMGGGSATITVYTSNNINFGVRAGAYTYQNAAHEFGHVFDSRTGLRPRNDLNAASITYIDPLTNQATPLGTGYNRENAGYATAGQSDWQQNPVATPGEDFADMFLGWAYSHFANNAAGAARYNWMSTNMAEWIALASR